VRTLTAEAGLAWAPPAPVAADGSYRLDGVLGETGMAWSAPGFADLGLMPDVSPGEDAVVPVALWPAAAGTGSVRLVDAEGRPVPGIVVRAVAPAFTPVRLLGVTDAAGTVPFPSGPASLGSALRPDLEGTPYLLDPDEAFGDEVRLSGTDPGAQVVVRLVRAARLRGRVLTESGRAVGPGFPVVFGDRTRARAETDAEGRFALARPLAPGRCPVDLVTHETAIALEAGDNDVVLRAREVVGFDVRPIDPASGEPWSAEGARFDETPWHGFAAFTASAAPGDGDLEGWVPLRPDPATDRLRGWGVAREGAPYVLHLRAADRTRAEFTAGALPVPAPGGRLRADVAVALEGYGRLRGRVRDAVTGGTPRGCNVSLGHVQASGDSWHVGGLSLVERDAFAVGPIRAGRYLVTVEGFDVGMAEREVEVVSGATTDAGEFALRAGPVTDTGRGARSR
jgi:hypothetical protein